ncbi:hypothetical protein [Pyxidicoccus xibeiensis]|uniref:hypothetical protein n=1 Tax=Pyxidicoccus xibeiensis TaxID=2906759 RepID=UPI0020A78A3C|nr:hypothetical protein [Pyxidicoccus xibeiensis]MCP3136122.1 hypothetical protein [Pyxidicoccus xibeiensis]
MRRFNLISSSTVMVALCTLLVGGCGGQPQQGDENAPQDPQSGGLESAPAEEPGTATGDGEGQNPAEGGEGHPLNTKKITICHIPPGNPANAHTITVGLPALKAHLKHGDTQGACGGDADGGSGEPDAGSGEPDAGGGEPDAGSGEPDAGSGEPDAGSACAPVGSTCGGGVTCCDGLMCSTEGYCEPIIG